MQLWQDKDMAECGQFSHSQAILVRSGKTLEEVVLDYIGQLWDGKDIQVEGQYVQKHRSKEA